MKKIFIPSSISNKHLSNFNKNQSLIICCFVFIMSLVFNPASLSGQCAELTKTVKKAEKYFDEGNLERSVELLEKTLSNRKFRTCWEEIKKANVLLTQAYLFMNKDSLATKSYDDVLYADPMYKADSSLESIDLVYFARRFHTVPRLTLTFAASLNSHSFLNQIVSTENINGTGMINNNFDGNANNKTVYSNYTGAGIGLRLGFHITTWLEIAAGVNYRNSGFKLEKTLYTSNSDDLTSLISNEKINITERHQWIDIPVTLRINLSTKSWVPVIFFGGEYNQLLYAKFINSSRGGYTSNLIIDVLEQRQASQYGWIAGLAFKYRPSSTIKDFLTINMKYYQGLKLINDPNNKYANSTLYLDLGYVDDDIYIGYFEVSVGYSLTRYRTLHNKQRFR